jgi:hypothetical protein
VSAYYSAGKLDAATALLMEWEGKHPDALHNHYFLVQRYFVAAIGQGDRMKATQTFRLLEQEIANGELDVNSDSFRLVSQHYYRQIPLPMLAMRAAGKNVMRNHLKLRHRPLLDEKPNLPGTRHAFVGDTGFIWSDRDRRIAGGYQLARISCAACAPLLLSWTCVF